MQACDWISPLAPDRTDIATYTRRVDAALDGSIHLNKIHDEQANDISAYGLGALPPFYNIGNDSRFHGGTVRAAMAKGGIIIAHDHLVQELLVSTLKLMTDDWASSYRHLMSSAYGPPGLQAALEFEAGNTDLSEISKDFSGLEIIASNALYVISHNPLLAKTISDGTGLYCFILPLPISVPPEQPFVRRSGDKFDIVVFGYMGENRNVLSLLDIIKHDDSRTLRLTIAGTIVSNDLRKAVEKAVAEGYEIRFPGFLADDALDRLIRRADLVVNVRSPSVGEVSGSQLRIFANGGLSVVSNEQWYATLPDDAVFKVDASDLARELTAVIQSVRDAPDKQLAMRSAGYRYLAENHALRHYRAAFEAMIEDSGPAIRHGIGMRIAARSADLYSRAGAGSFIDIDRILHRSRALSGWTV